MLIEIYVYEFCIYFFQCELNQILYPVFVHMYLELVYNGHEADGESPILSSHPSTYSQTTTYIHVPDIKNFGGISRMAVLQGGGISRVAV